ncbi:MAG: DNA translocase FtsK 4TM domain-containing protein [Lentisphaeria bacterium]|nr:DNA translocase FtsK 4TM domain-containing protein [Lentisphaeria bacterium]
MQEEQKTEHFQVRYIFIFILILLAFLAVVSYSGADSVALSGGSSTPPENWIGHLGAILGEVLFYLFGLAAYALILLTLLRAMRALLPGKSRPALSITGEFLVLCGSVLLLGLFPAAFAEYTERLGLGHKEMAELVLSGGVIGQVLAAPAVEAYELSEGILRQLIGAMGTMICGWAFLTGGALMIYLGDWHELLKKYFFGSRAETPRGTERQPRYVGTPDTPQDIPPHAPANGLFNSAVDAVAAMRTKFQENRSFRQPERAEFTEAAPPEPVSKPAFSAPPQTEETPVSPAETVVPAPVSNPAPAPAPAPAPKSNEVSRTITQKGDKSSSVNCAEYVLPPLSMLSKGNEASGEPPEVIERAKLILQRTLDSFSIAGSVVGHISGPRITRYEISLVEGVSVKKVAQIADDIKMALSAVSVRVLAPIPGRNVVGVEVPNTTSEAVFMRAVMETQAWQEGKMAIPIVLGKDVSNRPVVLDLAKAPHLLIAGSTGSGKSVCMNTLIMSLLFNFDPDDLKLIMVDPKIVEFEDYKKLPHLITPVINDAKKVPIALRWAVTEMEDRYKILARAGVKKLAEFNKLSPHGDPIIDSEGKEIRDRNDTLLTHMPILIVIIDELAELRMQDSWKDSETYIARIAQLGRAAGVHIVVATQRPSTNIITGVIKANLPTRIAFRVMQMVDSRVILDMPGAENLLGYGDMLYLAPGGSNVERVQGALVDDKDIKEIVKFVSNQRPQQFNEAVVAEEAEADDEGDPEIETYDDEDRRDIAPLLKKYLQPGDNDSVRKALEILILDHKASTSYFQRRLKIGYNRAAEIVDLFEERGIVGPDSGSGKPREILIFENEMMN